MRYYAITITDPAGVAPTRAWSSLLDSGAFNPAAAQIELDIPTVPFATPMGQAYLRIWGPSLQDVAQASNFNGRNITIAGGMSKGLPLANPKQAGVLVIATVQQAFGNWEGINQSLDFNLIPNGVNFTQPANLVHNWTAGTPLATVIKNTLAVAFPTYTANINISPNLVLAHDEPGFSQSLVQFGTYIKSVSQAILGGTYPGVDIVLRNNVFSVYDGTTTKAPTQVAFTDMIGQATWINPGQISFYNVMRADINVGDYIKMPPGQVTTTPQSLSQYRQGSVFQGTFQVDMVRHVGNFRQRDGRGWVTSFYAHPVVTS